MKIKESDPEWHEKLMHKWKPLKIPVPQPHPGSYTSSLHQPQRLQCSGGQGHCGAPSLVGLSTKYPICYEESMVPRTEWPGFTHTP